MKRSSQHIGIKSSNQILSFTMPVPIRPPSDSSDNLFDELVADMLELTDCASFANTSFTPEMNGILRSLLHELVHSY